MYFDDKRELNWDKIGKKFFPKESIKTSVKHVKEFANKYAQHLCNDDAYERLMYFWNKEWEDSENDDFDYAYDQFGNLIGPDHNPYDMVDYFL